MSRVAWPAGPWVPAQPVHWLPLWTPGQKSMSNPAIEARDVRLAAMNLLARREHSRLELAQKLRRRFGEGDLLSEVLDALSAEGLQSDARFAESFLRQRIERGYGPLRVRQEMRERGLDESLISAAEGELAPDWEVLASQVYQRKYGQAPAADVRERARRARFLQTRGFHHQSYRHLLDI